MTAEALSAPAPTTSTPRPAAPDIHSPDALTQGSPRTLAAALTDARAHTLTLARALAAGLLATLEVRYLPELNPPLWLLAELAWREDAAIARNPLRAAGPASVEGLARAPAHWPQYERSFAATLSHADRWHQPLPSLQATLAWLQSSRERTLTLLRGTPANDATLYVYRNALWREDTLREMLLGIAQTLGILPGPLAAAPPSCPASEDELALPVDTHRLGAPANGYLPEGDLPEQDVALRAYSIDRAPVTWGRYLPFIEAGGYDEARWWTPAGWAWRRRHSPGRPRHLGRSDEGDWQLAQFGQWVPLDPRWPAVHLSRHEAQAWCRWAGRRLPTEHEWEAAARAALALGEAFAWGQVREWTASACSPAAAGDAAEGAVTSAAGTARPVAVRGASYLGAPRLATPWRRWALAEDSNAGFVGFRSCALRDGDTAADDTPAQSSAAPTEAEPDGAATKAARKRAPRKPKADEAPDAGAAPQADLLPAASGTPAANDDA